MKGIIASFNWRLNIFRRLMFFLVSKSDRKVKPDPDDVILGTGGCETPDSKKIKLNNFYLPDASDGRNERLMSWETKPPQFVHAMRNHKTN